MLSGQQTKQIQELIDLLKKNNLTEMELEREGLRIRVRYETGVRAMTATVSEQGTSLSTSGAQLPTTTGTQTEDMTGMITIASPIVGTFYRSPSPDADPYVEEGDYVKKGQVLCIVEAMKLMNEIESEVDGRVTKILAESTKPVEYGQALFLVDPTATP
ncbi:MAG: acetyl-CoA carboxylase biotin carboxyl carrier protein [Nitrospiraceae bacterium]|nr:MAG: acetyl-CoA carboxylase biotin carboxyl carrier protein [Nitrospiraceae bacterium]